MEHIGYISQKYESGNSGPGTISTGVGDPGGVSYGLYQLSSNAGTLSEFIKEMDYSDAFAGMTIASPEFNAEWKSLAQYPQFGDDQQKFILEHKYAPVRAVATRHGLPDTPAIDEMLFSMAVQHGGAARIVAQITVTPGMSEAKIITKGYQQRVLYVKKLFPPNSGKAAIGEALYNRYNKELKDVLALCQ